MVRCDGGKLFVRKQNRMRKKLFVLVSLLIVMMVSVPLCAQNLMTGKASYYANKFHGRKTSSGEIYHRDSLTCAHRTLPFGTRLKVRNLNNGREVVVEVNDRGPFCEGRIVDLSYAAAKEIGILRRGVARVEVEMVLPFSLQKEEEFILPELILPDPLTGKAYTFEQWADIANDSPSTVKPSSGKRPLARAEVKLRWQVNHKKTTAQVGVKPSTTKVGRF